MTVADHTTQSRPANAGTPKVTMPIILSRHPAFIRVSKAGARLLLMSTGVPLSDVDLSTVAILLLFRHDTALIVHVQFLAQVF